ncbi:probable basic-leucine zipper transcription factor C [Zeugodacus cucurbitae]|nr:probable basic-leucine zipper transcription factor C [Zeugodacus cucurbitae]
MAPTICSEKKPRQIRANLKEIRRQPNAAANALLSTLAPAGSGAANGSGTSSIINYVAGARNSSTLRVRGPSDASESYTERIQRLHMGEEEDDDEDVHEISENFVSSSTMGPELVRAIIDEHMELDNGTLDEEDCEVHSITSGARYNSDITTANNNNNIGHSSQTTRQMLHCTVKTVFPAPSMNSDKQFLAPTTKLRSNNNNNSNNHKRHYGSDEEEDTDSDTYSSMCEIKKTEGLLSIALKTIKLVKRNQLLQRRLAQLQLETSEFIQSVMANPENQHIRNNMDSPATTISSTPSSPSMPSSPLSPAVKSPLSPLQSPTTTTTTAALQ